MCTEPANSSDPELRRSILDHYAFGAHDEFTGALATGYAMMYNHMPTGRASAKIVRGSSLIPGPRVDDFLVDYFVVAQRDIAKGEEIFSNYGDAYWFQQRGIKFIDAIAAATSGAAAATAELTPPPITTTTSITDSDAAAAHDDVAARASPVEWSMELPGCPSRTTQIVGGRVYSTQFIEKGEVIEVARSLELPELFKANLTIARYAWFAELWPDVAMLVLGNGAVYRGVDMSNDAAHTVNTALVNVVYAWHPVAADKPSSYWENLVNDHVALVRFTAHRSIQPGEELVVPMIVDPDTHIRRAFNKLMPIRPI